MEQLFTFLFKYRPAAFARGAIGFAPPGPWWLALLGGLVALGIAIAFYMRTPRLRMRDRIVLAGLRLAALALLVVCLAGPVLLVATAVPRRNVIAVLVDDSRSMGIADEGGRSRLDAAMAEFAPAAGRMTQALGAHFQVRSFAFADDIAPLGDSAHLTGRGTDLGLALDAVRSRLSGQSLAGVVVATDGGDGSGRLDETIRHYREAGIPVHVLGLGEEFIAPDVAIEVPGIPARALTGGSLVLDVRVTARGFAGRAATLTVEDEGAIVGQAAVTLGADGVTQTVPLRFTVEHDGPRRIRVRLPVQPGERVSGNNEREALVAVERGPRRILYFEGEPRFEIKFLRRAVAGDSQLNVVTLLRTADEKFLRLDVADSLELRNGFPARREDLFAYDGLVLGSVEASFFSREQLHMIADFVRLRGGGLLALGGQRSFANGGYNETPVADALPIVLPDGADSSFYREVKVGRTAEGRRFSALRLTVGDAAEDARWDSLPRLSILHPVRATKPGATTLLTGDADGGPFTVLALQHYGRGVAAAFTVQDSWLWQMDASIALEDQTHETLWRQLLRWLTADAQRPVRARVEAPSPAPGRPVTLIADVADSAFLPLNGAQVAATITRPDGSDTSLALPWSVGDDGRYRAAFTPAAEGVYAVVTDAMKDGTRAGVARSWFRVGDPTSEFERPGRQTALLRRLAEETGGHLYTPATLAGLAEDVRYTTAGAVRHEQLDLWDMPVVLLLLIGLLGAEWGYRRARGLA